MAEYLVQHTDDSFTFKSYEVRCFDFYQVVILCLTTTTLSHTYIIFNFKQGVYIAFIVRKVLIKNEMLSSKLIYI